MEQDISKLLLSVMMVLDPNFDKQKFEIRCLGKPHEPEGLPKGKMAIYMFFYKSEALKIGKVGIKSQARFKSDHYNPNSSGSNLAKSIINDDNFADVSKDNVKLWIKSNIYRIDIILDPELKIWTLNLFESILHYRYKPRYEGHRIQRNFYGKKLEDIF